MKSLLFNCKKVLSVIVANVMLALTLTATASMDISAVNTSQSYKVYNASNGYYIKSYTLSKNPVQDNSKSVIDSDDRVVDFSKSGVVKIIGGGFGTGFVIDAHTIATAAHCVCTKLNVNSQPTSSNIIKKILFFKPDGSIEKTITDVKQIHIPDLYISTPGQTNKYDYALITVSEDLSAYANFNLGVTLDAFQESGKTISCTGFPGYLNNDPDNVVNNAINLHNEYTGNGIIIPNDNDPQLCLRYNCDTSGGNSGGPVYLTSTLDGKVYYTVIGIHTTSAGSFNSATRMTTDLLHFYKNNPNITY